MRTEASKTLQYGFKLTEAELEGELQEGAQQ